MCETGRILHHLKNNITHPRNTVLIVGFQGANTLGRRLVEREPMVSIFGRRYHVKSEVVVLNGFSSHADRNELRRLVSPLAGKCRNAFLVHGEEDQMLKMSEMMRLGGFRSIEMPEAGQEFAMT
jgi:metallo-beta-lactamase family protein